ncbi:hypothetical protein V1478_003411 [Vespula squamosa]|uniref:Uncharacterized protein n=1 Tax=Vespula squamosa TaxID=30214 RepID=A0ABD2BMY2_VESSQ
MATTKTTNYLRVRLRLREQKFARSSQSDSKGINSNRNMENFYDVNNSSSSSSTSSSNNSSNMRSSDSGNNSSVVVTWYSEVIVVVVVVVTVVNTENSIRLAMIFTTGEKTAPPTATPPAATLSDITYEQDV